MLKKSTKSAIVMSAIACSCVVLTFLFWEALLHSSPTNFLAESHGGSPNNITILLITLLVLLVLIVLPGAFLIRDWSDAYFGKEGAVRWGLFGILVGSLARAHVLIPESTPEEGLSSFLLEKVLSILRGLVIFCTAHFLALKLLGRNQRVG